MGFSVISYESFCSFPVLKNTVIKPAPDQLCLNSDLLEFEAELVKEKLQAQIHVRLCQL